MARGGWGVLEGEYGPGRMGNECGNLIKGSLNIDVLCIY
jgi:hypothetical protein